MSAGEESYEARPFLKIRRAYIDDFEAARRKNFIHGGATAATFTRASLNYWSSPQASPTLLAVDLRPASGSQP
jgi:hypothetical protein